MRDSGELAAIRDRLASATPGPWGFAWGQRGSDKGDWHEIYAGDDEHCVIGPLDWENGGIVRQEDAIFVRHAPEDVAALLAEVERLAGVQAENAVLRAMVRTVADDHLHTWDAVDPQEVWACDVCGELSHEWAEAIQEQARALLADDAVTQQTRPDRQE